MGYLSIINAVAIKIFILTISFIVFTNVSIADDWDRYGNVRYQYWVDILPIFSSVIESANSDGGTSKSSDGRAVLRLWGGYLLDNDFNGEVRERIDHDALYGWTITYQKLRPSWASWSGLKGDRIFYTRAIPVCDGAAAYFQLEYDRAQAKAFDSIISRMVRSLRSGACR